jgi:aspartate/methionine/tyrosine aminotransferase
LNTRLKDFSNDFRLGGFRKGYATTDNFLILHILVNIMKCKKKKLCCAFTYVAAAFDTVWRDGLWSKLLINQINGKMYNVIFNMCSGIKSHVVYNYSKTEYFACNVGIRQSKMYPLPIFSLFE